jgi:Ca-activated chloride channel family protein
MRRSVAVVAALLPFTLLAATGCGPKGPPPTLHILAGSELADMKSVLDGARDATGIRVELTYSGSLDGAERIAAGSGLDAAWFSSDRYLALVGATSKVRDRKPIMLSPVVVGVKHSVASKLGWAPPAKVGWKEIAAAASKGDFRFAMTNPTASNTGFSALVGVATALNGGRALTTDGVDAAGLKGFFDGQSLTSASSGDLAKLYVEDQGRLDGIVNYESVLIELNDDDLKEPLDLIYPDEGITTADYPLMLLDSSKREPYQDLVRYLRRADVQDEIEEETARRPAVHGVPLDKRFGQQLLVEAPFPANLAIVRQLLDEFHTEVRTPAHIFYVLDTSGSMEGMPLEDLKRAMTGLAGLDRAFAGHFTRPPPRERATVILATTEANDTKEFDIDPANPSTGRTALHNHIRDLEADGNTILFTSLLRAYELAGQALRNSDGFTTSIVVMSDGDNTGGISYRTFKRLIANQAPAVQAIPTYTMLSGSTSSAELEDLADRTGGKVFDARGADLSAVAKEIRGYQ